jgi:hypothetical protein
MLHRIDCRLAVMAWESLRRRAAARPYFHGHRIDALARLSHD